MSECEESDESLSLPILNTFSLIAQWLMAFIFERGDCRFESLGWLGQNDLQKTCNTPVNTMVVTKHFLKPKLNFLLRTLNFILILKVESVGCPSLHTQPSNHAPPLGLSCARLLPLTATTAAVVRGQGSEDKERGNTVQSE